MSKVTIQKIPFGGWENCVQIKNEIADLIVTADVGPRIIRYGFSGGKNELCEVDSMMGMTGGDVWRIYGGHRLWLSPEDRETTYEPDNVQVAWEQITNGIKTSQDTGPLSGIKKEMEITLSSHDTTVTVLHRLTNKRPQPLELSVWSITAMAKGGKEVIPLGGRDTGLVPNRVLSLWPYTRLTDPRIYFGEHYIVLQHDPHMKHPLKVGLSNENGWAAYLNHGHLFMKYYRHHVNVGYPDLGVSYETYVNHFMLEMETLSPLTIVEPGSCAEHLERWKLFDNVLMPSNDESEIKAALADKILS
ncbi:MAG: hypothetical protein C4538_07075 [Nitrospiraceae bacterium]|nr:MAG: hypothetical protein C4538_07075 [Nitrospiraceae bacterium]